MYHKDIGSCEMYRHKTNARVQIPEGEKFMNERNVRPFSKRDEIGYVFGDMAGSFVNLFVDAYFLHTCATNLKFLLYLCAGNQSGVDGFPVPCSETLGCSK